MLGEDEWSTVYMANISRAGVPLRDRLNAMLEAYELLTGEHGFHPNVIAHHRARRYGSPCHSCGRPLRTPRASFRAACGEDVEPS
jgi:hypothetical protein